MPLTTTPWKNGKAWVYSITYDEALADLHRFAMALHSEFKIPGHVEVVAGHIGQVRDIKGSSYNGFRQMNADELRTLIAAGWGVGNHSWTHTNVADDLELELRQAKETIEQAIGSPVVLYCSPGANYNMADPILSACRRYGYLAAMSITDAVNLPGDELFWLNRCPIHHEFPAPFFSKFDPWRRIRQARETHGWIIDYCHCPIEQPVHPHKDVSHHELRQRFEAVVREGGDDVWLAVPEDVLDYHLTRRHTTVAPLVEDDETRRYRVTCRDLPEAVRQRELTFQTDLPDSWQGEAVARVGQKELPLKQIAPNAVRFHLDVRHDVEIELRPAGQPEGWYLL